MAQKLHETVAAETLARNYHIMWVIACLWWSLSSIHSAFVAEPFTSFKGLIGFAFTNAYYAAVCHSIFGIVAALWHVYCARVHQQEITKLVNG